MVTAPRHLSFYSEQGSPPKRGFPGEGSAPAPDVSLRLTKPHRHSPRLSAASANDNVFSALPIRDTETKVAIIGVGFVGESLLKEFSRVYPCIGFDISADRISELRTLSASFLQPVELTTNDYALRKATHFLISVPTLLRPDRSVNMDYVYTAVQTVLSHARQGSTIVIESSVSVGTTRQILGSYSHIHHMGMSPERVDPGRVEPVAHAIPKLVSGLTLEALKEINSTYGRVFDKVVPVSNPETAELTKLYENSFRMVNIAYANEMADFALKHGVDPTELVEAADTKPYGFMRFHPGLGVGGHCIPVNPYYLFATASSGELPVLERATRKMWARPKRLAKIFHRRACFADSKGPRRSRQATRNERPSSVRRPRILVVGVGFKPGQSVLSCSPGLSFAEQLRDLGCERLAFYDPLVSEKDVKWMEKLRGDKWCTAYIKREFDGVAVCTAQKGVDFMALDHLGKDTFVHSYVW